MIRQLSAIMFTDMVGYTALMQEDERRAMQYRDRQREVLERLIDQHDGEILQYYGDGALSIFQSAIHAVECAISIQEELSREPRVPLRIGIHTGDVVRDDEGVFGDGVNVASRVESLSVPGAVLISQKVADEVKNQSGISTRTLGRFALKNVQTPMEVHAVTNPGLTVPTPSELGPRASGSCCSVAVLPFVNMSPDPENEFFSDGVTEEIINALTRVNGLQVTARTSSFAFKGQNLDVREIGETLGVSTVLEGSVRKAGDKVRITAQLIDSSEGYHLFSKSYDRDLVDIFETQDEIARTIVSELSERIYGSPPEKLSRGHIHDTEAYTKYLKGLHLWNRWNPDDAREAIRHFEESIELDPTCSLPYSALSSAYVFLGGMGHLPPDDAYPKAREAATRAIEIESDVGESHAALGVVRLFHDWDVRGAYESIQKGLSIAPGSAWIHHMYGLFLMVAGDVAETVDEVSMAVQLDPLSLPINSMLGEALFRSQRYAEARQQFERVLDLDPEFRMAEEGLALTHLVTGGVDKAISILEGIPRRTGDRFKTAGIRGVAYAIAGREHDARRMLELLEERGSAEPDVSLHADHAMIHTTLGELDTAFEYLERSVEERLGFMLFLRTNPMWDPLKHDPRFGRLMDRIGISEEKGWG